MTSVFYGTPDSTRFRQFMTKVIEGIVTVRKLGQNIDGRTAITFAEYGVYGRMTKWSKDGGYENVTSRFVYSATVRRPSLSFTRPVSI